MGGRLKATASYFDGHIGADAPYKETAEGRRDNAVEQDTRNEPPVFGDRIPTRTACRTPMTTRKVEENTKEGRSFRPD